MLQPLNKECSKEVRRSTTRWFPWYQRVRFLTTITHYVILIICHWKLVKIRDWKRVYKPLLGQSNLHGNRHPICWEVKLYYMSTRWNKISFISCWLQSTNNISFQKSNYPTETKTIWNTKVTGNKTYKNLFAVSKPSWKSPSYLLGNEIILHVYTIR